MTLSHHPGALIHFLECAKTMGLKLPFGIAEVGTVSLAARAIDLVFVKCAEVFCMLHVQERYSEMNHLNSILFSREFP